MMGKTNILATKLAPPRLKNNVLHRPSITRKMKKMLDFPLIIIHSGPGYGKSTALSSFFQQEKLPFCWYSISEQDDDLVPFITYIIYAIRTLHPSFGDELLEDLFSGEGYIRESDLISFSMRFINELAYLQQELFVIIDDFHLVEHSTMIQEWCMWFVSNLPNGIHLVLSSRVRPSWSILGTMKVKGDLLELTEKDLAFTEEEIEVLFEDFYEFPLEPAEVRKVFQVTEGWVIAIQMIWQQLHVKEDFNRILSSKTESMEDLFQYLAIEVLLNQPKDVQDFLQKTSIFPEWTESICQEVLEVQDPARIIEYLFNKNLFIFSVGEGEYRYHALFRELLEEQLRSRSEAYSQLHKRAATYFTVQQQVERAIPHYLAIQNFGAIAEILQGYGKSMIENGQLENLLAIIQLIPGEIKDRFFILWVYEGDIHRYRSTYEQAMECYRQAEALARTAGDLVGESLGIEGQARIYLDTIQPKKADHYLKKAIQVLEEETSADPNHRIRLYNLMSENLINSGHAEEASKWYAKSKGIRADDADEELEARLHLRTGRLHLTQSILEKRKQRESRNWKRLPRSHRETELLLSLVYSFIGEPEKAKKSAEDGIMQGIKSKSPFVEACGWIRMGHAVQLFSKYDQVLAQNCYQTALSIMEEINVSRGKAEPLMGLCVLYGRERKLDLALHYGAQALEETEKVEDIWLSALIKLSMGISCMYSEEWVQTRSYLTECLSIFEKCGDSFGYTVVLLWYTLLSYKTKSWNEFESSMEKFLRSTQAGGYEFLLHKRTLFGPRDVQKLVPLLMEAQGRKLQVTYVAKLLESLGLEHMTSHPGYTLRVQTLGEFRLWLGEQEIGEKEWQREKAKELFQLLITKRHQFLQKEEIFHLLWRDLDESVATRDLKVALNALNKVLEPQRTARSNPFFIQRHESAYGLHAAAGLELDAAEFEVLIQEGLEVKDRAKAREFLERGLALYAGDYLPERRHEDWCIEERERLQVLFLRGAEKLAQINVAIEEYDQAISWCEQIIAKDSCWEEAYRLLMYCYYRKNNRPQALKWYQRCLDKLREEIGVAPMPATEQMYRMIMQTRKASN